MDEERTFHWTSIIWSVILIAVIAFAARMVIGFVYVFIVVFPTRGDPNAIQQASVALVLSPIFWIVVAIAHGLLAFWRGTVLSKTAEYRPKLQALIAAGVGSLCIPHLSSLE